MNCPECGSPAEQTSKEKPGEHWRCSNLKCCAFWGRDPNMTYHHSSAEVQQLLTYNAPSEPPPSPVAPEPTEPSEKAS